VGTRRRTQDGVPRDAAVRRLLVLRGEGRLTAAEAQLAAAGLGVSLRTVWRWLEEAQESDHASGRKESVRERFEVGDELRERLAYWRGNITAVHRELVAAAAAGGPEAPSRQTLQRAVQRDVLRGDRAGLRAGELARREHDVFLSRPATHRNEAWEGDHVEAPVWVDVEGRLLKPWVTWFVDAATNAVAGVAVTPGPASRESILAALRWAIALEEPYGPPGGLPGKVRIDRGKDFLSRAMMCVHGDAGLGKTLSVNAALRALVPADVCRVQFRARPTPRDIRHVLFEALGVGGSPPSRPIEFDTLLKDALAERFRVLVCDEAQWLSRECFELWRHLWDDRRTNIAIVFVGGGDCYRVLRREPMLSSRVYVWQEFRRLDRDQVLAVIPAYHPVWADADPADIAYTDAHAGHGNFRAWSKITSHVVTALARLERDVPDREVLQWVFSRIGGTSA